MSELFYKNVPKSLYIEHWDAILPRCTWCVANFVHLTTLAFQCPKHVRAKMTSETLYVKSLSTS